MSGRGRTGIQIFWLLVQVFFHSITVELNCPGGEEKDLNIYTCYVLETTLDWTQTTIYVISKTKFFLLPNISSLTTGNKI